MIPPKRLLIASTTAFVLYLTQTYQEGVKSSTESLTGGLSTPIEYIFDGVPLEETILEEDRKNNLKELDKILTKFDVESNIKKCEENTSCRVLAEAAYYEARGERSLGLISVMKVILNRVEDGGRMWPNSVKSVVYQPKQFSYTHDGSLSRSDMYSERNREQYERIMYYAYDVYTGKYSSPVGDSVYYHADYVTPYWSNEYKFVTQIGAHKYYE